MASPTKFSGSPGGFKGATSAKTKAKKTGGFKAKGTPGTGRGGGNIGSGEGGGGGNLTTRFNNTKIPD